MNWLETPDYLPVTAPRSFGSLQRTPENLDDVLDQFRVETTPRYQRSSNGTKCNIFLHDVTKACGCAIPIVWQVGLKHVEMNANNQYEWMLRYGVASHGWLEVPEAVAQAEADKGRISVAMFYNTKLKRPWLPAGALNQPLPGHVAAFRPSHGAPGSWIAQAGAENFSRGLLHSTFGNLPTKYFTHA